MDQRGDNDENEREPEVWAPVGASDTRSRAGTPPVSLGAYFLRDLHRQGLLDEARVREVIESEKLQIDPEEAIAVIRDAKGKNVPAGLADAIDRLALVMVPCN